MAEIKRTKNLGVHVNGGLSRAVKMAEKYKFDSAQIMPSAPMRWATRPISEEKLEPISKMHSDHPLRKILLHGVYLTNLARKDKQLFHLSKLSLVTYLNYAQKLINAIKEHDLQVEVLGICFHPGSAIDLSPEEGLERISYGINWVMDEVEETAPDVKLLLETTAGSGNVMGDTFAELAKMRERVKEKYNDRIGYVLDTQHTWVSGYNWVEDLDGVVAQAREHLGAKNIAAVHLNDSMKEFDSHKDRHADIGEGKIGVDAIKKLIAHDFFTGNDIPFILETPGLKTEEGIESELAKLR